MTFSLLPLSVCLCLCLFLSLSLSLLILFFVIVVDKKITFVEVNFFFSEKNWKHFQETIV